MKIIFFASFLSILGSVISVGSSRSIVCYYDSKSHIAEGLAQFTLGDLELAFQFCTHVIYGYAGIKPDTFEIKSLNEPLDVQQRHFAMFTSLKQKYPHIKFLLSVGGDRDLENPEKYLNLLEAVRSKRSKFIESARDLLRSYNFDGLDLAFQFPKNKPRKVHSDAGMVWKNFKKFFTGDHVVDEKAHDHREQFTDLVKDLSTAFQPYDLILTLTVLPNVNSSWYFDGPALISSLEFVNLATYDFLTPERNPEEADYASPLLESYEGNRLDHYNINYQAEYWILQRIPKDKIHIGIATYGRSWKMTKESGDKGVPIVRHTDGPAPAGTQTRTPGMLNWAEICIMLPNPSNANGKGPLAPLRRVPDLLKRYGSYAFRAADEKGEHGMWVSYDDPDSAAYKAGYVKSKDLGGVALFDLNNDDFRGQCTGDKYPLLRAIKYRLL